MNQKVLKPYVGKLVRIPFTGSVLEGRLVKVFEKWLVLAECVQDGVHGAGVFVVAMPEWVQVIP